MGFRVSARDLGSGASVADYDTRAASAAEARAEAARLGVQIVELRPLPPGHDPLATPRLDEWAPHPLAWSTSHWTLLRLGFEHPRWGRVLYRNLLLPLAMLKSRVLFRAMAAAVVALLGAVGIQADPAVVMVLMIPLFVLGPLLATKGWIVWRLRRHHARAGCGLPQQLRIAETHLDHHDGQHETRIAVGRVRSVHELPHFVLIGLEGGEELAIPAAAFGTAAVRRRFAGALARAGGIAAQLGYRSEWLGQRRERRTSRAFIVFLLSLAGAILVFLLVAVVAR